MKQKLLSNYSRIPYRTQLRDWKKETLRQVRSQVTKSSTYPSAVNKGRYTSPNQEKQRHGLQKQGVQTRKEGQGIHKRRPSMATLLHMETCEDSVKMKAGRKIFLSFPGAGWQWGEERKGKKERNLSDNLTMSKSLNLYIKYKQTCWRVWKVKLQVQKQTPKQMKK